MQWIKDIVTGLIEACGTSDIKELLKYLDVTIIEKKLINPHWKAWLYKDPFLNYYIHLSNDLDENMKKFILYHELGHILVHVIPCDLYCSSNLSKGKVEHEAHYFALLLHLSTKSYEQCYLEGLSMDQLISYLEIPKEFMKYCFEESDIKSILLGIC